MNLTFDDYLEDPQLGGFSLPDLATFEYQQTAYRIADAVEPRPGDMERLTTLTGRTEWPSAPASEVHHNWCRRSGKSLLEMHRAAWHGIDDSHLEHLAAGERATIRVTCPSKQQAQDSFGFLLGIFEAPLLKPLIERTTQDTVSLANRIDIRVQPASFRTSRGGSTKAWFFDEANFLFVDGLNALPELLAAAHPSLATVPGSRLYLNSSVYDQTTEMAQAKRRYWAVNDAPVLVTVGGWEIMRPDLKGTVEKAMERDPERARAEWFSEERSAGSAAFLEEWVEACMTLEDRPIPRHIVARPESTYV